MLRGFQAGISDSVNFQLRKYKNPNLQNINRFEAQLFQNLFSTISLGIKNLQAKHFLIGQTKRFIQSEILLFMKSK